MVSSQVIVKQAHAIAHRNPHSALHQFVTCPEEINTETVLKAFENGDPALQEAINRVGYYLGIGVANLVGALNIQKVVIAGSLARFGQALLEPIQAEVRQRSMQMLAKDTRIELSKLGQDIVVQGAAALLLTQELEIV
jgi:predicted NBD/HSP70 family sugar kinase